MRALYLFHETKGSFIPLRDGLVLGRSRADLNFEEDPLVSRQHCRILVEGDEHYIEDLGARNRTRINHIALEPKARRRVHLNDVIKVGNQRLILTHQNQAVPVGNVDPTCETQAPILETQRTAPAVLELSPEPPPPEPPKAPPPKAQLGPREFELTRIHTVQLVDSEPPTLPPVAAKERSRRIVRERGPRPRVTRNTAGQESLLRFIFVATALVAAWYLMTL